MIVDRCPNCVTAEGAAVTAAADVEFLHTVARNMKTHIGILERDKAAMAAEILTLRERLEGEANA